MLYELYVELDIGVQKIITVINLINCLPDDSGGIPTFSK